MESDDDYQSFSPPSDSPSHFPKFKRLKKKSSKPKPIIRNEPVLRNNEPALLSPVDFAELEALEGSRSGEVDEPVSRSDELSLFTKVDFAEIEALEGSRSGEVDDEEDVARSIRDEVVDDGVNLFMNVDFARLEALEGSRSGEVDEKEKEKEKARLIRDELVLGSFTSVDFKKLEELEGSKSVSFDDSEEVVVSQSSSRDEKDSEDVVSEDLGEKISDLKIGVMRKKRSVRGGLREKKRKIESVLSLPRVDFAELEELESSKNLGFDDLSRESFGDGEERGNVDGEVRRVTKRVLDFDDENGGGVEKGDGEGEKVKVSKSGKKRISEGECSEKKEKKKRVKGFSDEGKLKEKPSNKRREEKVYFDVDLFSC